MYYFSLILMRYDDSSLIIEDSIRTALCPSHQNVPKFRAEAGCLTSNDLPLSLYSPPHF